MSDLAVRCRWEDPAAVAVVGDLPGSPGLPVALAPEVWTVDQTRD